MSSKNRNLQKRLNKMNKQLNNDEMITDWTTSISAGDERFIKMMFGEMFSELLDLDNIELVEWCRERNIYYEMDFYSYIAEINKESNTGQFDWLTK